MVLFVFKILISNTHLLWCSNCSLLLQDISTVAIEVLSSMHLHFFRNWILSLKFASIQTCYLTGSSSLDKKLSDLSLEQPCEVSTFISLVEFGINPSSENILEQRWGMRLCDNSWQLWFINELSLINSGREREGFLPDLVWVDLCLLGFLGGEDWEIAEMKQIG